MHTSAGTAQVSSLLISYDQPRPKVVHSLSTRASANTPKTPEVAVNVQNTPRQSTSDPVDDVPPPQETNQDASHLGEPPETPAQPASDSAAPEASAAEAEPLEAGEESGRAQTETEQGEAPAETAEDSPETAEESPEAEPSKDAAAAPADEAATDVAPEQQQEAAPEQEVSAPEPASEAAEPPRLTISTDKLSGNEQAACYIVKKSGGALAPEALEDQVEVGVFSDSDSLQTVSDLFEHVFIPALLAGAPPQDKDRSSAIASGVHHSLDADMLAALQKFLAQMKTSSTHLTGNVQLSMPELASVSLDEKDDDLLQGLEGIMHDWTLVLQTVKQAEAEKTAGDGGPLDEIYFWSERNNVLGSLSEQVESQKAQQVIQCVALPG